MKQPRWILIWGIIAFIALAKFGYFWTRYLVAIDTWQARREAINLVETKDSVLTNNKLAPQLSHRAVIKLALDGTEEIDLTQFEYILLDLRHPGWGSASETVNRINAQALQNNQFDLHYSHTGVVLWQKLNSNSAK